MDYCYVRLFAVELNGHYAELYFFSLSKDMAYIRYTSIISITVAATAISTSRSFRSPLHRHRVKQEPT